MLNHEQREIVPLQMRSVETLFLMIFDRGRESCQGRGGLGTRRFILPPGKRVLGRAEVDARRHGVTACESLRAVAFAGGEVK